MNVRGGVVQSPDSSSPGGTSALSMKVSSTNLILTQNREGMGTDDIFNSGSQSSSAVAGSILPSPYSSCSKVKTFKGNTRRVKNLACIFDHKALVLVCFTNGK